MEPAVTLTAAQQRVLVQLNTAYADYNRYRSDPHGNSQPKDLRSDPHGDGQPKDLRTALGSAVMDLLETAKADGMELKDHWRVKEIAAKMGFEL